MSGYFLLLQCFIEIPVFNANSADPDQTPQNMASILGLHCLPTALLGVSNISFGNMFLFALHLNTTIPSSHFQGGEPTS